LTRQGDEPLFVNGVGEERDEIAGLTDLVLEGACDLIRRSLEDVESVVIVVVMRNGDGSICSSPALGRDLRPLLQALADGMGE
jgi:hypothetical protein